MLDEKIVEAVARAIAGHFHKDADFGMDGDSAYAARPREFKETARAAIAAYQAETADAWLEDERTGTLYQVIGSLAEAAGVFCDPAVVRALDLAAYGKTGDGEDVLPFAPEYPASHQAEG